MGSRVVTFPREIPDTVIEGIAPRPAGVEHRTIGRYRIDRVLGRGGMGIVYEAFDPKLERAIAIKVVRTGPTLDEDASKARARTKREAQALARLTHRNVVEVYDVGDHGSDLYIAMELVDGRSLRAWVQGEPRPNPAAILDAYLQAGAGLAASHAAGVVHRDFKPDNAMIDDDGRVRVLDFGLASGRWASVLDETGTPVDTVESSFVTRSGIVVGTPAYMSPEQYERDGADAKSDQFAYCVALWEALYGQRPFRGRDFETVRAKILTGAIDMPEAPPAVEPRIARVLRRGLSTDPRARWPSMDALLDALSRRRWSRPAAALALVVVGLGSGIVALVAGPPREAEMCAGTDRTLAGVWDPDRRTSVSAAFAGAPEAFAPTEGAQAVARLDAWTRRWADVQRQACARTRIDHAQSETAFDRQLACLHDRRARLGALVGELERGALIEGAANAARSLPAPETCADPDAIARDLPLPGDPVMQEQVAEVRARLAEIAAAAQAGRLDEAAAAIVPALDRAERLGFRPLLAEAEYRRADLLVYRADPAAADRAYERAYTTAVEVGYDALALKAATSLFFHIGVVQARIDDAPPWLSTARALLTRSASPPTAAARLDISESYYLSLRGDDEGAARLAARARAQLEPLGEDEPLLPEAYSVEAAAYIRLGRFDEARALLDRDLELASRWGSDHPFYAAVLANLGLLQGATGEFAAARESFAQALPVFEAKRPDSIEVATALNNLGSAAYFLDDFAAAREAHEKALEIRRARFGDEHESVAESLHNLANNLVEEGHPEAAVDDFRRALAIRERVFGPGHRANGETLQALASVLGSLGRTEEALEAAERSLAILEATAGRDHPDVAMPLWARGDILLRAGRDDEAIEALERAAGILREAPSVDRPRLAMIEVDLSRALARSKRDPARAEALAHEAVRSLRGMESPPPDLADAEAWLAEIDPQPQPAPDPVD